MRKGLASLSLQVLEVLGAAEIVEHGNDLTIVTWSNMRQMCMEAANKLRQRDIGAEVIDLRTLWPWDRDQVLSSVSKTGTLLIVHESVRGGGFGAEIAAEMGEALWGARAPIRRIGLERAPMPFSLPLEKHFRISVDQIVETAVTTIEAGRDRAS